MSNSRSLRRSASSISHDVLESIASRFLEHIHAEDTFARIGGGEFALLVTRDVSKEDLFHYLSALTEHFHQIKLRKDVYSDIQLSMWVAFCPAHASVAYDLLHLADVAMYNAKRAGKARVVFFEPAMQEQMDRTIRIEQNCSSRSTGRNSISITSRSTGRTTKR